MSAPRMRSRRGRPGGEAAARALAFALVLFLLVAGCEGSGVKRNPSGLFVVTQGGRAGYMNQEGRLVIPVQFDKAYGFTEGLGVVVLGGRWGYIDWKGKIVINPQFDEVQDFSGGLALVDVGGSRGYIDRDARFVWNPSS